MAPKDAEGTHMIGWPWPMAWMFKLKLELAVDSCIHAHRIAEHSAVELYLLRWDHECTPIIS